VRSPGAFPAILADMVVQFTAEDYAARMRRTAFEAARAGFAGLLVTPGPDLVWLTGYRPTATTERMTVLILRAGEPPRLVVPKLEEPDARAAPAGPVLDFAPWTDGVDPYTLTWPLLGPQPVYAIADSAWALHVLGLLRTVPGLRLTPLTEALLMLRAVKDQPELERLAAAGASADAAYGDILKVRFAGRQETEIAADLAALLRKYGHEQVDFTVVGSGPNGANPHHEAGDRTIRPGDTVVLDFGGLRDGYGSDTTRTVHVGAGVDDEVRSVHALVRTAQQTAFAAVRPGATCQDIDRAARKVITDGGYGEYFIHRTGHGIGVTTHEPPYLVEGEDQPLVAGMCFSIEPGVYLPGKFGVRLEDIVTVTGDGGRRLNNTSHDLAIVA
jgi:Xaa-Pro aminopeptidase